MSGVFAMEAAESKKFYGSVTVSERGQIVIPSDARKDFGIITGDKLLVFGDQERGIGIATFSIMQRTMEGTADLFNKIGSKMSAKEIKNSQIINDINDIKDIK
jgi:AbrB family looped-hinge helix DNA binding protein